MVEIVCAEWTGALRDRLTSMCADRLPYETCGVVIGSSSPESRSLRAEAFVPIRNVAPDPERGFRFDPAEWTATYYRSLRAGREIIGYFHSHPAGKARPSREDEAGWNGWGTYWIVGFAAGAADVRVYRKAGRRLAPLTLRTV